MRDANIMSMAAQVLGTPHIKIGNVKLNIKAAG
jgi:hypothetical protein